MGLFLFPLHTEWYLEGSNIKHENQQGHYPDDLNHKEGKETHQQTNFKIPLFHKFWPDESKKESTQFSDNCRKDRDKHLTFSNPVHLRDVKRRKNWYPKIDKANNVEEAQQNKRMVRSQHPENINTVVHFSPTLIVYCGLLNTHKKKHVLKCL